jgi:hypothetical protein
VATITVRPWTAEPSASSTEWWPSSCARPTACAGTTIRAPNRRACSVARSAGSLPEIRREAEVVLDPCRRAGLAAERDRVDHLSVESLRGAVHGRGETRRPGADDDQIAERGRSATRAEPEQLRDLRVGWVPQHTFVADHDRRFGGVDAERLEQRIGFLVLLEVHPLVGHPVAGQELSQAMGAPRVARADQLHTCPDVDQDLAAREVGAQDDVAQLLVFGDQRAQPLGRHLDDLAGVADDRGQVRRRAGQQVDLAEEPMRALDGDDPVLVTVALDDHDHARLDHEEVEAGLALSKQDLAGLHLPHLPDRAKPRALLVAKPRERTVAVDRLLEAGPERFAHQACWTTNIASST